MQSLIGQMAAGEVARMKVLEHVECCVEEWYQITMSPLDARWVVVPSGVSFFRMRLDACLMPDACSELIATFRCRPDAARLLVFDALSRLVCIPQNGEEVVAVWKFRPLVWGTTIAAKGRRVYDMTGDHWMDWRKTINAN